MPQVTSDIPRLIQAGLKVILLDEMESRPRQYDQVCTDMPSNTETQSYAWLGAIPMLREFKSERVVKSMPQFGFDIKDKTWEATIGVNRRAIENDQFGAIKGQVGRLAEAIIDGINRLAFTMLREANTATYGRSWDNYDKNGDLISGSTIYFADTDHVYPAPAEYTTSQANKGASALSGANLQTARIAMMTWKADNYQYNANAITNPEFKNEANYYACAPNLLIVPPKLGQTAWELVNSAFSTEATYTQKANYFASLGLSVLESEYWVADDAGNTQNWMLCNTKRRINPLILQRFVPAGTSGQLFEVTALEAQSESGFMRDEYLYGVRGRFNIGYGDWRQVYENIVA